MALLYEFLCTPDWYNYFHTNIVKSLSKFLSDYNLIILSCTMYKLSITKPLRFEPTWLSESGFLNLLAKWWLETHIIGYYENSRRLKLQKIRRKLRRSEKKY
jgi:hypothetical protein